MVYVNVPPAVNTMTARVSTSIVDLLWIINRKIFIGSVVFLLVSYFSESYLKTTAWRCKAADSLWMPHHGISIKSTIYGKHNYKLIKRNEILFVRVNG